MTARPLRAILSGMTLTPRWRKALLTLHVVTAVGWLGTDFVMLFLAVAGVSGADPAVVYPAISLIGLWVFMPLSFVVWIVGVLNSLLTPWGLFRHWWVVVKLAVTTLMLVLVVFALRPGLILMGRPRRRPARRRPDRRAVPAGRVDHADAVRHGALDLQAVGTGQADRAERSRTASARWAVRACRNAYGNSGVGAVSVISTSMSSSPVGRLRQPGVIVDGRPGLLPGDRHHLVVRGGQHVGGVRDRERERAHRSRSVMA